MSNITITPVLEKNYSELVGKKLSDLLNDSTVSHVKLNNHKTKMLTTIKAKLYKGKHNTYVIVAIDSSPKLSATNLYSKDKIIRHKWVLYFHEKGMIQDHIAQLLDISQSLVSKLIIQGNKLLL